MAKRPTDRGREGGDESRRGAEDSAQTCDDPCMAFEGRLASPCLPIPDLDRCVATPCKETPFVGAGCSDARRVAFFLILGRCFEAFGEPELSNHHVVYLFGPRSCV